MNFWDPYLPALKDPCRGKPLAGGRKGVASGYEDEEKARPTSVNRESFGISDAKNGCSTCLYARTRTLLAFIKLLGT